MEKQQQTKARIRVPSATRLGKPVGSRRRPLAIRRLATIDFTTLPSDHISTQYLDHAHRARVLRKMAQVLWQVRLPGQGAVPEEDESDKVALIVINDMTIEVTKYLTIDKYM